MENKIKISNTDLNDIITKSGAMTGIQPYGCDVEWLGYTIHIKRFLDFTEMMGFVNGVVSGCFAKSDNGYIPEVRDFFFRCSIVECYTNIELPEPIEEKNQLLYGSNIIETILHNVDMGQFQAIMESIEKKVSYLVDVNVKQINDEVELVYNKITELYDQLSETFSGIDKETIANIARAISGTVIDEKKLVDAVIDARNAGTHSSSDLKVVTQNG